MSWRAAATLTLIAWGSLAFGAVYPWAFQPLWFGCAVVGAVELIQPNAPGRVQPVLAAALALLIATVGFQLLPLSIDTIRVISPESDVLLRRYEVGYGTLAQSHPLSIKPRATALAFVGIIALTIFFLGSARALTNVDTRQIARGVSIVGIVLALVGVTQKALWNGKIYGLWTPIQGDSPFGPFVNRNHFAGWMLMALPLAIGYLCKRVTTDMRPVKLDLRNRLLWFSSSEANQTIFLAFSILIMATALALTLSRSGILGLMLATLVSAWFVVRGPSSRSRRVLTIAYILLVVVAAIGWAGDPLALRFSPRELKNAFDFGGRITAWTDAWHIVRRFPLTGTGVNTYGVATVFYQTAVGLHYREAHNDYLQLLAEGGLLVSVPAGLALLALGLSVQRRFRETSTESTDYWIRMGAVTGILAIALQEIFDFSLQMPGNAVLFVVLLALAVRQSHERRRATHGTPESVS